MTACPLHPDVKRPCHVCGVARVRAAMPAHTPRTDPADDPNPTRARALAKARTERTNAKEE